MKKIKRGEIFNADLDPVLGHEQGGNRPVLVLQNNHSLKRCPTVLVAPLTKMINKKYDLPTHVYIEPSNYLKYDSVVLAEHIREIDRSRITYYLTTLTKKQQKLVDKAIINAFGLSIKEINLYGK